MALEPLFAQRTLCQLFVFVFPPKGCNTEVCVCGEQSSLNRKKKWAIARATLFFVVFGVYGSRTVGSQMGFLGCGVVCVCVPVVMWTRLEG